MSLVAFCILTLSSSGITIKNLSKDQEHLLIGKQYSSVIKITTGNNFCSGIILSKNCVLSAKHSTQYKKEMSVYYKDKIYTPKKIEFNNEYDASLLLFDGNIFEKEDIAKISEKEINKNQECISVGFGKTGSLSGGANRFDYKKRGAVNFISSYNEKEVFIKGKPVNNDNDLLGMISVGDSGGGLFIKDQLVAIHSYVYCDDGICDSNYLDKSAHLKIKVILPWINKYL